MNTIQHQKSKAEQTLYEAQLEIELYPSGPERSFAIIESLYLEWSRNLPKDNITYSWLKGNLDHYRSVAEEFQYYELCASLRDAIEYLEEYDTLWDCLNSGKQYRARKIEKAANEVIDQFYNPDYLNFASN